MISSKADHRPQDYRFQRMLDRSDGVPFVGTRRYRSWLGLLLFWIL